MPKSYRGSGGALRVGPARWAAAGGRKPMRNHLPQNPALDRLICQRRISPPPAIVLHGSCRRYEAVRDFDKLLRGIIEAEDQATGSNPAQRQALGMQVILQHPVVARRLRVTDGPNRGHVCYLHRQVFAPQAIVEPLCPLVPDPIEVAGKLTGLRHGERQQKLVHRSHHVGMGVEGPAGEADLRWSLFVKPSHQVLASADHTNGKPAPQRLPVGAETAGHPKIFLCSTDAEAKSDEYLIEDQDDVLSGADRAQSMEPLGVG